jgi:tripartite-type tricarboxylate transporter receptor subunit TctC
MKLSKKIFSPKRRLLLSAIPALISLSSFASSLKKTLKKPLQIIFPIPFAGSINREIPIRMFESAGIDYYIENKFGASGLIASQYMKEDINGNSLMIATNTILLTNFLKNPNRIAESFEEIFQCIGMMYRVPFVLVTRVSGKYDANFESFVDKVKKSKLSPTYSIYGYYDIVHLCGLMLSKVLNVELKEIPYKNSYLLPVLSGEVDFSFVPLSAAMPYIKASQLSAIAHTGQNSTSLVSNLYSLSSLRGFHSLDAVYGLVTSKFMPQDGIYEVNRLLNQVLSDKNFEEKQLGQGISLFTNNSPNDYLNYLRNERKKYQIILKNL